MAPKYKLTYFDARGRAEPMRLMFAAKGVEYEDVRLSFPDWGAKKGETPMGQMPLMEVDGHVMCQSGAIRRYVARETGMGGKNSWEEGQVDMFSSGMDDLLEKLFGARFEIDEAAKAKKKEELATWVPNFLANYEKLCGPNGYLVGSSLTYADLSFFCSMHDILKERPDTLDKYPKLAKVVDSVKADKKVAAWLAKRPVTNM